MPEFSINSHSLAYLEDGQFLSGFQTAVTRSEQFFYVTPLFNRVKECAGTLKSLSASQASIVEIRSVAKQLRTELQDFKTKVTATSQVVETEAEGFTSQIKEVASTITNLDRVQTVRAYLLNVNRCVSALSQIKDAINECKSFRTEFDKIMLMADGLDPTNQNDVGAFTYNTRLLMIPCKQVKDIVADLFSFEKNTLTLVKRLSIHKDLQYQLKFIKEDIFQGILLSSLNSWLSEIRKGSSLLGCRLMLLADQTILDITYSFSKALLEFHNDRENCSIKGSPTLHDVSIETPFKQNNQPAATASLLEKFATLGRNVRSEYYFDYINEILAISELLGFKEEAIAHIISVRQKQEPVVEAFDYLQYMESLNSKKIYDKVYAYIGYFFYNDLLASVVPSLSQIMTELTISRLTILLRKLCDDYCNAPNPAFIFEFHRIILCMRFLGNFIKADDIASYFMDVCLKVHCETESIKYHASITSIIQDLHVNTDTSDISKILTLKGGLIDDLLLSLKGQTTETSNDITIKLQRYIYYETLQKAVNLSVIILNFTFDSLLFFYPSCDVLQQYSTNYDKMLSLITFVCCGDPIPSALAALRCVQEQVNVNTLLDRIFSFLLVNIHPQLIDALSNASQNNTLSVIQSLYLFKGLDVSLRLVSKVIFALFGSQELCRPFNDIIDPLYASMFSSLSYVLPDPIARAIRFFAATNQPIDFYIDIPASDQKIIPGTLSNALINRYTSPIPDDISPPFKLFLDRFLNYFIAAIRFLPTELVNQIIKISNVLLMDSFLQTVSKSTSICLPSSGGLLSFCKDLRTLQEITVTTGIYYELSCSNTYESILSLYTLEENESMRPPKQVMFIALATAIAKDAPSYGGFKIQNESEVVTDKINGAIADLSTFLRLIESNDRTISLLSTFQLDNQQNLPALLSKCYETINGELINTNRLLDRDACLVKMLSLSNEGFRKAQAEFLDNVKNACSTTITPEKPSRISTSIVRSPESTISPSTEVPKSRGLESGQLNAKIKTQFLSIFAPKRTGKKNTRESDIS